MKNVKKPRFCLRNTSWDAAKYEVCGHKWADLSEHGFGVAILNDSKYGYSCYGNKMSLSLLRAPKAPDAQADMGEQKFKYALMPHAGPFQKPVNCEKSVIQAAYELNLPIREVEAGISNNFGSFLTVDNSAVIVEAVKKAENVENGLVLRLYEAHGGKAKANLKVAEWVKMKNVIKVDLLEREIENTRVDSKGNLIELCMKPFEIVSLLVLLE